MGESSQSFLDRLEAAGERLNPDLVRRAHTFAQVAHQGQSRRSGEPYFLHCEATADILLDLRLDSSTLAAGLLHDTLEDTPVGLSDLKREFGPEVAGLVEGVTKISSLKRMTPEPQGAEDYRKMLLALTRDLRVLLVKLADRLHNMRTLEFLEPEKQRRIAQETRDLYAPIAHRIGMAKLARELEDLAFRFLEPQGYVRLAGEVESLREDYERYLLEFSTLLEKKLEEEGIVSKVVGRLKHLASIHRKMTARGKPLDEIYDLMAFRVVVPEVRDCYHVLGVVHSLWTPVMDRIKDYIAKPKANMYQSLHTTVIGLDGRWVEIQIRTRKMDRVAEEGVAAHWEYKLDRAGSYIVPDEREKVASLKHTLAWVQDRLDPREYMSLLRMDLYKDEVFAFTPKGTLKRLQRRATCLDFAFAIHSEVGLKCTGSKVNGKIAPLTQEVQNGDIVEILTTKGHQPSRDWLAIVKTSRAKTKLRQHFREQDRLRYIEQGRRRLSDEAARMGISLPGVEALETSAKDLGLPTFLDLLARVGEGEISPFRILHPFLPAEVPVPKERIAKPGGSGVRVDGVKGVWASFAKCCQPLPGDTISGNLSRARGVVIHQRDCPSLKQARSLVQVQWDGDSTRSYAVLVALEAKDRMGLLGDISKAFAEMGLNLRKSAMAARDGRAYGNFTLEVKNLTELERALDRLRRVPGVLRAGRRKKGIEKYSEV